MPLITWGSSLETGVAIIDSQHKRLVGIINDLDAALAAGNSHEIMGAIFEELVAYTETHFGVEEKLMSNHEYEDLEEHRREHLIFTEQIKMDRDHFEAGSRKIDSKLMVYLRDWLMNHISLSDQAYVPTLKEGLE